MREKEKIQSESDVHGSEPAAVPSSKKVKSRQLLGFIASSDLWPLCGGRRRRNFSLRDQLCSTFSFSPKPLIILSHLKQTRLELPPKSPENKTSLWKSSLFWVNLNPIWFWQQVVFVTWRLTEKSPFKLLKCLHFLCQREERSCKKTKGNMAESAQRRIDQEAAGNLQTACSPRDQSPVACWEVKPQSSKNSPAVGYQR